MASALAEIRDLLTDGVRRARHGHREVRIQQRLGPDFPGQWQWMACLENGHRCCPDGHNTPEQAAHCMEARLR